MFYLATSIALSVLALPPFGASAAGLACWIPLLAIAATEPSGRAAFFGACYGFVIAAYVFLGAFAYSALVYLLTIVALSTVFGVFLLLTSRLLDETRPLGPLQAAITWVFMEMICELARLPFTPVLALTQAPVLLQTAELGGQYLVSFLFVLFQASVATIMVSSSVRQKLVQAWGASFAVTLACAYAASDLTENWRAGATSLRAAVVQTDAHPAFAENWKADGQLQNLARMRAESYADVDRLAPMPELVVWPEVWFAGLEMRRGTYRLSAAGGPAMLVGAPESDIHGRRINSIFSVTGDGEILHRHDKKLLLPLLEDEYARGSAPEPHRGIVGTPGSLICFESAFPSVATELTRKGARLLAISTSDAYAGPSFLAFMHHDLAVIRAVENRRTILRAANGGPSSIILPTGEILDSLGLFEGGVLVREVPLVEYSTVYTTHAGWWRVAWLSMLSVSAWGLWRSRRSRARRPRRGSALATCFVVLLAALSLIALQIRYTASLYDAANPGAQGSAYSLAFRATLGNVEWRYDELTVLERDRTRYAALAYLLREHGVATTAKKVRELAATLAAPNAVELEELAAEFGFAISVDEYAGLAQAATLPAPALVELQSGETVVLQEFDLDRASFFSPLRGEHIAIKREAFVEAWRGATLRLEPETAGVKQLPDRTSPL